MPQKIPVSLVIAFAVTSLSAIVPASVFAQPRDLTIRGSGKPVLPPAEIEAVDAAAKTISLRNLRLAPEQDPLVTARGGVQMIPADLETVPLASDAIIVRLESAIGANALKVGDTVSLLGQKAKPGVIRIVGAVEPLQMQRMGSQQPLPELPAMLHNTGLARYSAKAELFKLVSLNPLTLKKGSSLDDTDAGASEDDVLRVPFTNGPDATPIGTLSVGTVKSRIRLGLGSDNGKVTEHFVVNPNYVATLRLTATKDVEFDRFTPMALADVAAARAAGKVDLRAEFGQSPDGKREVTRLVVTDIKRAVMTNN